MYKGVKGFLITVIVVGCILFLLKEMNTSEAIATFYDFVNNNPSDILEKIEIDKDIDKLPSEIKNIEIKQEHQNIDPDFDDSALDGTVVVDDVEYQISDYLTQFGQQNYLAIDDALLYDGYMKILYAAVQNYHQIIEFQGIDSSQVGNYVEDLFAVTDQTESRMILTEIEYYATEKGYSKFTLKYNDQLIDYFEQSKAMSQRVANDIFDQQMNDMEKAKAAYDYLVLNTEYDQEAANFVDVEIPDQYIPSFNSYGVFYNGSAVCQGYAYAYNMLMATQGFETRFVESEVLNHAWSMVEIDGNWYHCDPTYDDPCDYIGNAVRYQYFLKNDAYMEDKEAGRLDFLQQNSEANSYYFDLYDFRLYMLNEKPYAYRLYEDAVYRYDISKDENAIDMNSGEIVIVDVASWYDIQGEYYFVYTQKSDGDLYVIDFDGRGAKRLIKRLGGYVVDMVVDDDQLMITLADEINGELKEIVTDW